MFDITPKQLSPTCVEYLTTLQEMCGENQFAYAWLTQVIQAALIWDHVADGDGFEQENFDAVMLALITEWPRNPFLRQFGDYLSPVLVTAIAAWKYGGSRDLHYSVYREVPCAVAFILGGHPLVARFMPKIAALVRKMREEDDVRDAPEVAQDGG